MPRLIPLVRRAERAVGRRLEEAVETGELTAPLLRAASGLRTARKAVDRTRSAIVHALYLPSQRDVRRLTASVARLEAAVHELALRSEDREEVEP